MSMDTESKGRFYRQSADVVTYGRTVLGAVVAINIVSGDRLLPRCLRHRSVGAALGVGVLGLMDKLDGMLARKAAENGIPITKNDKEKDPREDKRFNRFMMGAIIARELFTAVTNKDIDRTAFAVTLAVSLHQTEDRNERMEISREQALPGANTEAIKLNKYKTLLQNIGHTIAVSPLPQSGIGQAITTAVYTASNVLGEIGLSMADRIHRGEQLQSYDEWTSMDISDGNKYLSQFV